MKAAISDAFSLIGENLTDGPAVDALRELWSEVGRLEGQEMIAHRRGFTEACDLMGLPSADTPMERIVRAGGNVS